MRSSCAIVLLAILLSGCKVPPTPVYGEGLTRQRYTRVNLRPDGTKLRPAGLITGSTILPIGSPAQVTLYSDKEIHLRLGEAEYVMTPIGGDRFPTDERGLEVFLAKYFVDSPEETGVDRLGTPELRANVVGGVYMIGMTKEQVFACLGPPYKVDQDTPAVGLSREEILASDHWVYPESWLLVVPDCADFYFGDGLLQKRIP